MSQKRKLLWLLLALGWVAVVMLPAWWNVANIQSRQAEISRIIQVLCTMDKQVLGFHIFVLLAGLAGILIAYLKQTRHLAERDKELEALVASEERFRGIFENASVGIAQIDPDGRLIGFNRPFEKLAGRSRNEIKACNIQDLFIQSHRKSYREASQKALREGEDSFTLEVLFGPWREKPIWGHLSQALIRDASGKPDHFVVVVKDVTDRKLAERKLSESKERFRLAFETSPDSVSINRLRDGSFISINQGFTNTYGYTKEEVIGTTSLEIGLWQNPAERQLMVEKLLRHGQLTGWEARLQAKDGSPVDGLMSASVTQMNGEPHIVFMVRDIGTLKAAHEKLAVQQKRFEAIMLANPDPMVVFGIDRRLQYMNPAFTRVFGWTLDETRGHILRYVPDKLSNQALIAIEELKSTGWTKPIESQRLTKDGRLLDVLISAAGIRDQDNKVTSLVVNLHDITPLKQAEARQRRMATALEQAAEAVFITGLDGGILHVNPAFEKITGYTRKEVIGENPRILKSGYHDDAFYRNLWETITSGEVWSGRLVNRSKAGKLFHEEATISPVRDPNGAIVNFVAVKRDVSKEIHLEERLRRSEKMEAIGTMAGGIAHDFNNILGAITGYSELALDGFERDGKQAANDLRQVLSAAERAKVLIRQILTFSREVEPDLKPLDLNSVVEQSLAILEHTLPKMIEIRIENCEGSPHILGDCGQLEQVLLNLAANARDAMDETGTLVIRTSEEYLDSEYCRMEKGMKPGRYGKLTVSDTGCGMKEEIRQRIFEPFFTTKETGKGTGLGLSMVFGIVKAHGGHIRCKSRPGHGASFKMYFPALEQPGQTESVRRPAIEELPTGTETVLLIDDENQLREMTGRILEDRGFLVRQAANGEQGLKSYKEAPEAIDLIVLDLSMPGMGGQECLKRLLEFDPGVRVIISSGYAANGTVSRTMEMGAAAFVPKPYNKTDLLAAVRRVLDES
jgi:two-component system cell cycle sensor histidine kinase/response regulator CckA